MKYQIETYFVLIMERISQSNKDGAKALFKQLTTSEKMQFHDWLETTYFYESHDSGEHGSVAEITKILG